MMKESIQQKDIKIINVYTPNIKIPKFINQILAGLKGEIHSNTIRVGNFNTPLSIMKRVSRQEINKERAILNNTMDPNEPNRHI